MPTERLNIDDTFKNLIGRGAASTKNDRAEVPPPKTQTATIPKDKPKAAPIHNEEPTGKTLKKTIYIPESLFIKARIKAVTSKNPKEKDWSAIVCSALDSYLAE